MLLDDDVGALFGGVGEEVDEAGDGNGEDAGAVPMQGPVHDVGLRPWADEEHDPAPVAGIGLQARHLRGVEAFDIEDPDGVERLEIEGGQRPGRFGPRLESRRRSGPWRQGGGEVEGIAGARRCSRGGVG